MIALLVLISLLASYIHSGDDDRELQSMYDIHKVLDSYSMNRTDLATALWSNKNSLNLLLQPQREVIWSQIACETRPELHEEWKRSINNSSEMVKRLDEERKKGNVNCENETSNSDRFHQCLCDNSSHISFCLSCEAELKTAKYRHEVERHMGEKIPCANELWQEMKEITKMELFFEKQLSREGIDRLAQQYSDYSNNKKEIAEFVRVSYEKNSSDIEQACFFTPNTHRIISKLRHVDIRFRIFDDLLRMKFISMVPFNFCYQDYLLSKCMCDQRSSAAFCLMYFVKQSALVFVNETMCAGYSPGLTSTAPTSFSYSIILILLSWLIFKS